MPIRAYVYIAAVFVAGFFVGGYVAKYNQERAEEREHQAFVRYLEQNYAIDLSAEK